MSTALKSQPPRPKCAARARHLGPQAKQAPIAATAGHHRCFMDDPRKRARRATGKPPLRPATSGRTSRYRREQHPPCPRLFDRRRTGVTAEKRRPRWTYARWVRMLCRDERITVGRRSARHGTGRSRRSHVCQISRSRCAGLSACTSRICDACDHVGRPARRIRGLSNGTGYVPYSALERKDALASNCRCSCNSCPRRRVFRSLLVRGLRMAQRGIFLAARGGCRHSNLVSASTRAAGLVTRSNCSRSAGTFSRGASSNRAVLSRTANIVVGVLAGVHFHL